MTLGRAYVWLVTAVATAGLVAVLLTFVVPEKLAVPLMTVALLSVMGVPLLLVGRKLVKWLITGLVVMTWVLPGPTSAQAIPAGTVDLGRPPAQVVRVFELGPVDVQGQLIADTWPAMGVHVYIVR